jgi:hypothetical protein
VEKAVKNKVCASCSGEFSVFEEDLKFYEKMEVPEPTWCPSCRAMRRLAFRNERHLYHRKCDLSGKEMLSVFSPDKPVKVYLQSEWWSDKWDALDYGRDFDFSRGFFEQFHELLLDVPQMNVIGENNENSDYCNLTANCKNCYLVFESSNNEDCFYGYWLQKCLGCVDTSFSHECQYCYEVDNCYGCYNLKWSQNCVNSSDSAFLRDCVGCKNCLFCMNLRHKEYFIFNIQYSREEYERILKEYNLETFEGVEMMKKEFETFRLKQPHRGSEFIQTENCTGEYINQSKDCFWCFHAHEAEDCRYGEHVWRDSKSNMDVSTVGRGAERCYEAINTGIGSSFMRFTNQCWSGCSDLTYCSNCFSSQNCFGCVGLRHGEFCILNKQYSKEEYFEMLTRIIEHMRRPSYNSSASTSSAVEWGEFFPMEISLFEYFETPAAEQYPMENTHREFVDKPYKIISQEKAFYEKMGIPEPKKCPEQRHLDRMNLRNPHKLWNRKCDKCSAEIWSSFSPNRPEIVYCEKCYLEIVN